MKSRDKREEVRGKRAEKRAETDSKRDDKRGKARAAAALAGLLAAALCGCNIGCNSMVPSMGSNRASYDGCTATVNLNLYGPTNAPQTAAGGPVWLIDLTIHDLLGTQSCSTEGSTADQSGKQAMTPGVTGDKPVEVIGETVADAATGGVSTAGRVVTGALIAK